MAKFGVDPHGRWDANLAQAQFKGHVENIINKYHEASPELLKGGSEWYEKAHDLATKMGHGDTARGAGVIAALSPMSGWDLNLKKADELMRTGHTIHLVPANVEKAKRIHQGEDPREVLGGHKVRSFFENIVDPSNPEPVTIDRHAHDLALGKPFVGAGNRSKFPSQEERKPKSMSEDVGLSSIGRYKHFENAYKSAAGELGIEVPNKVQATSWVTHRGAVG